MSVTDDTLKAKFSTLNETQDSIVSVANWMMFHRVAQAWYTRLRDVGSPKRLNLIYLTNEVVQQSKLRHRSEFPDAFSPIIADAVQLAYKGAPTDVQQKIRRVVEVWRSRSVFEVPIVDAIEGRLDDIDKTKGTGKKPLMGGSLFSTGRGSVPKELETLASLHTAVSKTHLSSSTAQQTANSEYDKLNDANAVLPPPPVHAARLSSLMKALANAETSINETIKARTELITELEKLLEANKAELSKDESHRTDLSHRKVSTEAKKRDVEDAIMRGMSTSTPPSHSNGNGSSNHQSNAEPVEELERPEYEALTPPPVESLTPPPVNSDPTILPQHASDTIPESADVSSLLAAMSGGGSSAPPLQSYGTDPTNPEQHQESHTYPQFSNPGSAGISGTSGIKKRKLNHEDEIAGFNTEGDALEDLDDDVAEMLRQSSSKS
ncbi:hypothetical protein UCRPC4_g00009 [Phaeomoniella chlamydospora]|uniref:CID domain-containing protein n=1 Tax=Phaeomoniella chlamydospora TaxID=158046 RepID=A0A0G2F4P6_PHACM|nr:hypothetical protein UCRPC4_g00009 [Phaeomoniella chlamydospora]